MFTRRRLLPLLLSLLPSLLLAQNPSYPLTQANAEKFVRASQQMTQNGAMPKIDASRGPPNFQQIKADLDRTPAAQQALSAAGLSSTEFVSFMSSAMSAMMVGQMEAAGLRGAMPPGMTQRPSQQNIDFMKENPDFFQRAVTPGLARAAPPAANTTDVGVPMPANTGSVLASVIVARVPRLDTMTPTTDCTLGNVQATIEAEAANARTLAAAQYGNPGFLGARRTPAEGAVFDRANDADTLYCGSYQTSSGRELLSLTGGPRFDGPRAEYEAARVVEQEKTGLFTRQPDGTLLLGLPCEQQESVNVQECRRERAAARARFVAAMTPVYRRYLSAIAQPFADYVGATQACTLKREAVVADAKTAKVSGANVNPVMDVLVSSWELPPMVVEQWAGYCKEFADLPLN